MLSIPCDDKFGCKLGKVFRADCLGIQAVGSKEEAKMRKVIFGLGMLVANGLGEVVVCGRLFGTFLAMLEVFLPFRLLWVSSTSSVICLFLV